MGEEVECSTSVRDQRGIWSVDVCTGRKCPFCVSEKRLFDVDRPRRRGRTHNLPIQIMAQLMPILIGSSSHAFGSCTAENPAALRSLVTAPFLGSGLVFLPLFSSLNSGGQVVCMLGMSTLQKCFMWVHVLGRCAWEG